MDVLESFHEEECLDFELMERFSELLLNKLTQWANNEIFHPIGGELTTNTPLKDSVNAAAIVNKLSPKKPTIIIHFGMIKEIYRDALTFPIYSEKLASNTHNFKNKNWDAFKGARFKFESGVPDLMEYEISHICALFSSVWLEVFEEKSSKNPSLKNEKRLSLLRRTVPVRFLMFELMLSWVFFHELSHLIQCHYKLKENTSNNFEFYEINGEPSEIDIGGQSREILADIEGLDLTIRYMEREGFCGPNSMYLLLCSVTCMFNRFCEKSYSEEFHEVKGVHPHPVIRDDFMHAYFCVLLGKTTPLVWKHSIRESILMGYAYLTIRSGMAACLFWANKYQEFDGHDYPSYMTLQMKTRTDSAEKYKLHLGGLAHEQLEAICGGHLYKNTITDQLFVEEFFKHKIT
nr:hypothetical protein [uncultured Shewanella sp.]